MPPVDLDKLLIARFYPERTRLESEVIRDFLTAHGLEYDRIEFSVRVGQGRTPNPAHLPGVQRATVFSTQKRIDLLCWQGTRPTIVEVKIRLTPASLGQIKTYRALLLEQYPELEEPKLLAVGAMSDEDTLRALTGEGVDVFLYPDALNRAQAARSGDTSDSGEPVRT